METIEKIKTARRVDISNGNGHQVTSVEIEVIDEITPQFGMGWLPDLPDFRDYDLQHDEVKKLFKGTKLGKATLPAIPASVDLRPWCSPVENQGSLGSCTANAGAGLLEYYERRAFGNFLDASRLFLYKATRNYIQLTGDTGA